MGKGIRRRGRKRASGKREPNGRASRSKEPRVPVDATALAQPHRRGNKDQRCVSVFGRFCIRALLRSELFAAGEEYGVAVLRWRAAKGIPVGLVSRSGGLSEPRPPAVVQALGRRMLRMERAMAMDAGFTAYLAVRQLVVDENPLGMDQDGRAISGLMALAVHLGWLRPGGDPYIRRPVAMRGARATSSA